MTPAVYPPPPDLQVYPLSALFLWPISNTSPVPVDPTKGYRNWQYTGPLPPGKTTASLYNYGYYTGTGDYGSASITYGEAMSPPNIAAANLDAPDALAIEAGAYGLLAHPVPARALLATESISSVVFLGLQVRNSAWAAPPTPQQSTDSSTLQQILENTAETLAIVKTLPGAVTPGA
jgi:hypothetical protein